MERVPEPEIMDDEEQVAAYAEADFSASNQLFVDTILGRSHGGFSTLLDIGCGPGDVPVRLALAKPDLHITAVDGSGPMAYYARDLIQKRGMEKLIEVVEGVIPGLDLGGRRFDVVVSKDLLHHLPNPAFLWKEIAAHSATGTRVFVMDLLRPGSRDEASRLVESVSARESEILKLDFYNSLLASFTIDEVRAQVDEAGLELEVTALGDRHFFAEGAIR